MSVPNPSEIEVLNYRFSEKAAAAVLTAMLNQPELDYAAAEELSGSKTLSAFSAEDIRSGISELHTRGFLLTVQKPHDVVYAVNKLRIANMMFVYG